MTSVRRTVVALGYEQNESEARPFLQHEDSVVRELALERSIECIHLPMPI